MVRLADLSIVVLNARLRLIFQALWNHILPLLISATVLQYPLPVSSSGESHRLLISNQVYPLNLRLDPTRHT